ncbi:NAD(P)-dependent oxidoreductase [Methylobacillus sp. MM3]|jgi:NAD(P)-dependent dehydrogenase (short-subunit alcohol dehydrogenase family)|uniref:YciK family oxidoreductase n=1 Tax=Methylobacillus sp. MM3 TaxID=1848039 RepID=UPI0007DE63A3|nr:YciK family oxidoreductase [Methylobacillus sp. MM3]OAJ71643.1 NAD(P)-dependent oxidoreductase [Methylobacillus sp. MM3]
MNYQPPQNHLQDRVILVTGAGQGIGKTAALAFATQGATVILLGRKVKKLEAVYDAIVAAGGPLPLIFPMNLEKAGEEDFKGLAEGIYQQLGRLDGILHNASRFDNLSPLEIQTTEQFTGMLQTNLIAPFALTKACLPLLKRAPDASVIITSTTAAHHPTAYWGMHAISNSAAETLVRIWAQELETFPNMRINAVIPGPVQCPQRKLSHPGELHANLPKPEAIMPLYLYLMGHDSAGISGQTFEAQKPAQ